MNNVNENHALSSVARKRNANAERHLHRLETRRWRKRRGEARTDSVKPATLRGENSAIVEAVIGERHVCCNRSSSARSAVTSTINLDSRR